MPSETSLKIKARSLVIFRSFGNVSSHLQAKTFAWKGDCIVQLFKNYKQYDNVRDTISKSI